MSDKAPVCPWCGSKMEFCKRVDPCMCFLCCLCGAKAPVAMSEDTAYKFAMKQVDPMQKPLTECEMEAISKNENEHVFVVDGKGKEYIALVTLGVPAPNDGTFNYPCGVRFNAETWDEDIMDGDFYGMRDIEGRPHQMGWIAFKRKPTDEERKAAKWE